MRSIEMLRLLTCAALAVGGCTSLFVKSAPTEAELKSAALLEACPLGVPSTRVRSNETTEGIDLSNQNRRLFP